MAENNNLPAVVVPVNEFSVPSPIVEVSECTPGSPKGVFPFPVPVQTSVTTSAMGGGTTGTTTSSSSVGMNPPLLVGLERRGSAPDSRRGSNQSIGQAMYGGLPPLEPSSNPRRGSATGSYGLPVPPDWIRAHAADKVRGGLGGGGGGTRGGGSYLQASSSLLGLSGGRDYSPTRFKPSKQAVQKFPPPATYQSNGIHKNQVGCSYLSTLHIVCNV